MPAGPEENEKNVNIDGPFWLLSAPGWGFTLSAASSSNGHQVRVW